MLPNGLPSISAFASDQIGLVDQLNKALSQIEGVTIRGGLVRHTSPGAVDISVENDQDLELARDLTGGSGGDTEAVPFVAEITALQNDYLTVQLLDSSGTKVGAAFNAAKPYKLRHLAANYDWVTTWTSSTDTNTAEVTDGSDSYIWRVTPDGFAVGEPVLVFPVAYTGVTVSSADLKYLVDQGARHWAAEDV